MISQKLLNKYRLPSIEEYRNGMLPGESELVYYYDFLKATDYIPNKIIEAQILGEEIDDYTEILNARKYAREMINTLITK